MGIEYSSDPLLLFREWSDEAYASGILQPDVVALATSRKNIPTVRLVVLRSINSRGATFYTNGSSRKGLDIASNPFAAAVFPWHEMGRQVRIEGPVRSLSDRETDLEFASHSRDTQCLIRVSAQSKPIRDIADVKKQQVTEKRKWRREQELIARPAHWRGYQLELNTMEFWEKRPQGLHCRRRFRRESQEWTFERLSP